MQRAPRAPGLEFAQTKDQEKNIFNHTLQKAATSSIYVIILTVEN